MVPPWQGSRRSRPLDVVAAFLAVLGSVVVVWPVAAVSAAIGNGAATGGGISLLQALRSAGALFDAEAKTDVPGFSEPVVPRAALERRLVLSMQRAAAADAAGPRVAAMSVDTDGRVVATSANKSAVRVAAPPPPPPLHGFYVTVRANAERQAVLESLLAQEPAGSSVRVVPHVADEWHRTVAGAAPEPTTTDSHVAVLRRCIAEGLPACLVMEDDAVWDAAGGVSLHETFQQALRDLDGRPWDVIIMGHNILRGVRRELTHGPFDCAEDLEVVTPTLARLKWRTGWGCHAYVVHERYYGDLIRKVWGSKRYACIEELTDVGDDQWYLTSPLPVSQQAKRANFAYSQTPFFRDCVDRSAPAALPLPLLPAAAAASGGGGGGGDAGGGEAAACTRIVLGDGLCDRENNVRACNWDGGDCVGRRPFNTSRAATNAAALAAAARTSLQLIAQGRDRPAFPRVHLLHVPKTGGLSLRDALGCFCGADDYADPTGGRGAGHCDRTTRSGPFVCHGHAATCADVPEGEPYIVFFRDPYSKVLSATAHQQALFPGLTLADSALVRRPRSPHQRAQSDYVACGAARAPAFVGHTESLAADWARLRAAFAPEIAQADARRRLAEGAGDGVPASLPHRHNKQARETATAAGRASAAGEDDGPWRTQVAVQYRADFALGDYTVDD